MSDEFETERERHLHAMYDAWKWLEWEAEAKGDARFAGLSRAILRGQLEEAEYRLYVEASA